MEPGLPLRKKRRRKDEDKDEQVDDFLVRNLKEESCTNSLDEENLFGRQVPTLYSTAKGTSKAALIQGVLMDTEFPEQPFVFVSQSYYPTQ